MPKERDVAKIEQKLMAKETRKQPLTGTGGKYNFPQAVQPEDPETVREVLGSVLYWFRRGVEDKPQTDDEVEDRVLEYLSGCYETGQRMTVEKMALALGVTRETLHSWETGETQSKRRSDIIKRAKESIAAYDADMVTGGKMNPVPYIFRAKNYYGMKDTADVAITAKQGITDESSVNIADKYASLPDV